MEFDLYFGLVAVGAGIYCIYASIMMKKTGVISTTLLLDKETARKKCSNIDEFLKAVIPPTLMIGMLTVLYGALLLINLYVMECGIVLYISMGVTLLALFWYAIITRKAKEKYYI